MQADPADSAEPKLWFEIYKEHFGNRLPVETVLAWSETWGRKGYTDSLAIEAVRALIDLPALTRPQFPQEDIRWIEGWMSARTFELAVAGSLPIGVITRLRPQWDALLEIARKKSRDRSATNPDDRTTPEAAALREISQQLKRFDALIAQAQLAAPNRQFAVPDLGIGRQLL